MAQTYARLTGDLWLDPGLAAVPDKAFRIFIASISFSGGNLTDGFVPHNVAHMLTISLDEPLEAQPWAALIEAGLWLEVDGGYLIKGYLKHNKSREEIEGARKKAAERTAKHRETKASQPNGAGVTRDGDVTSRAGDADVMRLEEEEELDREEESKRAPAKRKRPRTRIPVGWTPSDDLIAQMDAKHPGINAASLVDGFRNYHEARGSLMASWDAAFRTWCGKERPKSTSSRPDIRAAIAAFAAQDTA